MKDSINRTRNKRHGELPGRGEVHRVRKFMRKVSTRSSTALVQYAQNPDFYMISTKLYSDSNVLEQKINFYEAHESDRESQSYRMAV